MDVCTAVRPLAAFSTYRADPPTTVANLQLNTLADGLFHLGTYILVLIGLFMLWRVFQRDSRAPASRVLVGTLLMGWGIFNLVEGLVDHYLLQIHHVRPGPDQAVYDFAFLVWGALMLIGGWLLARRRAVPAQ